MNVQILTPSVLATREDLPRPEYRPLGESFELGHEIFVVERNKKTGVRLLRRLLNATNYPVGTVSRHEDIGMEYFVTLHPSTPGVLQWRRVEIIPPTITMTLLRADLVIGNPAICTPGQMLTRDDRTNFAERIFESGEPVWVQIPKADKSFDGHRFTCDATRTSYECNGAAWTRVANYEPTLSVEMEHPENIDPASIETGTVSCTTDHVFFSERLILGGEAVWVKMQRGSASFQGKQLASPETGTIYECLGGVWERRVVAAPEVVEHNGEDDMEGKILEQRYREEKLSLPNPAVVPIATSFMQSNSVYVAEIDDDGHPAWVKLTDPAGVKLGMSSGHGRHVSYTCVSTEDSTHVWKRFSTKPEEQPMKPIETRPLAERVLPVLKSDATDAAWRTGGTQLVRLSRDALAALLMRHLAPDGDATVRERLAGFLRTDVGEALLSTLLAASLTVAPVPGVAAEVTDRLAREMRVRSLASGGDMLAEVITGPLRTVMMSGILGEALAGVTLPAIEEPRPVNVLDGQWSKPAVEVKK